MLQIVPTGVVYINVIDDVLQHYNVIIIFLEAKLNLSQWTSC